MTGAERDGYTVGMKTAVSIADDVFKKAERFSRRKNKSRSEVYSAALAEYLARHDNDAVTEAMDSVLATVGPENDSFAAEGARRILRRVEW